MKRIFIFCMLVMALVGCSDESDQSTTTTTEPTVTTEPTTTSVGPSAQEQAAEKYLDALRNDQTAQAYDVLCKFQKDHQTQDEFAQNVERARIDAGGQLEFNVVGSAKRGDKSIVLYDQETNNGVISWEASMVNEDGMWTICGINPTVGP